MINAPEKIEIVITGNPVAKGRARSVLVRGKGGKPVLNAKGEPILNHKTPKRTENWENDARHQARIVMRELGVLAPFDQPLKVLIEAVFLIPTSWAGWKVRAAKAGLVGHVNQPDSDNLVKAAADALNGVVWRDDRQVNFVIGEKFFGNRPLVRVTITRRRQLPSNLKKKPTYQQLQDWGFDEMQIAELVALGAVDGERAENPPRRSMHELDLAL